MTVADNIAYFKYIFKSYIVEKLIVIFNIEPLNGKVI